MTGFADAARLVARAFVIAAGVLAVLLFCFANPFVLHPRYWTLQVMLRSFAIQAEIGAIAVLLLWGQLFIGTRPNDKSPSRSSLLIWLTISTAIAGAINIAAYVLHR